MSHRARFLAIPALLLSGASYGTAQVRPVVGRIMIEGNRRVPTETLWAVIHTHPGGAYREKNLQRDVRALWNTKKFSDIRLEVRDDPERANTKIVYFHLIEKPAN